MKNNYSKALLRFALPFICAFFFLPVLVLAEPVINGPTLVCQGSTHTYTASADSGYALTWRVLGTGSFISSTNINSAGVYFGGNGLSIIELIAKRGALVDTIYFPINVQQAPSPTITQPGNLNSSNCLFYTGRGKPGPLVPGAGSTSVCYGVCDSTTVQYAVADHAGSHYTWVASGGTISISTPGDGSTANIEWGASSGGNSYSLTVTETDSSGCTGSASICVVIIQKPQAVIFVGNGTNLSHDTVYTCLHSSVSFFSDSSTGDGTLAQWIFSDNNSTSDMQNPTYQFNTAGTFTVTLVISNCSCTDTARVTVVVSPLPGFTITCPSTLCPLDTSKYTVNDSCSGGSPMWNVTGGSILAHSSDSVIVAWGNGNNGPGSLSFTGNCAGYCPYPTVVSIPIVPQNGRISGPNHVCPLSGPYLYSVPLVPSTQYYWSITGSGVIGNNPDPALHGNVVEVLVDTPGTFDLHVNYYNPFLHCGGSADTVISILPTFDYNYTPYICAGGEDSFYTIPSISVTWCITDSVGDTTCSATTSASMVHTFAQPGLYTITANPGGGYCNAPQHQVIVTTNPVPPGVIGIGPVCPGGTYSYTDTPVNGAYTAWTITGGTITGSGTTAQGPSVSITWNNTGPYIIGVQSITVAAPYCASGVVYDTLPAVTIPVVKITGPDTVCEDADNILFTATGGGFSYAWAVLSGPGSVIGQQDSVCHVIFYHQTGTAILQLTYKLCSYTVVVYDTIQVVSAPAITLTASTPQCYNQPITFMATPGGTSYNWNFGNGITSSTGSTNTTMEAFQSDTSYTVVVDVTGINGCIGQSTASVNVNINPLPLAMAAALSGTTNVCPPTDTFNVNLYAYVSPGSSIVWYDSTAAIGTSNPITVTSQGSYYVVVTSPDGCVASSNVVNLTHICNACPGVPDSAAINISRVCNTINVSAVLPSNCFFVGWNFGDLFTSDIDTTSHTYVNAGYYAVTLYAGEVTGPGDTCYFSIYVIELIPLVAKIADTISCNGGSTLQLQLTNISEVVGTTITSSNWTILPGSHTGSGLTYTLPLSAGLYTVILMVTDDLGDTCLVSSNIAMPVQPTANFTINPNPACLNIPVMFIPTWSDSSEITSFLWDFNNGYYSADDTTSAQFTVLPSGFLHEQPVTLTIHDIYGCIDSITEGLPLVPNNVLGSLVPDSAFKCLGDSVELVYLPGPGRTAPTTYTWVQNGTDTVANGYVNPFYAYQSGSYTVYVADQYGCPGNAGPAIVQFQSLPTPAINGALTYCQYVQPSPIFSAFMPAGLQYTWTYQSNVNPSIGNTIGTGSNAPQTINFDSTTLSGYLCCSSPPTWLTISLTFTDTTTGCSLSTGPDTAYIHQVPYIYTPTPTCANGTTQMATVTLYNSPFPDSVIFTWSTGQVGQSVPVLNGGVYGVTATSIYGCSYSTNYQLYPEPNFSELISGCYSRCDTATLYGPAGYANYSWLRNDTAFSGDSIVTVALSGTYQLVLTTTFGCRDTSPPIYVTLFDCDTTPCCCFDYSTLISDSITCEGMDSAGSRFNLSATIWYPGPVSDLTLGTDLWGTWTTLNIVNDGVTQTGQAYTFNGTYTAPSNHLTFVVLKWMIKDSCHVLATQVLPPPCDTLPCCTHINFISDSIYCNGLDSAGDPGFRFTSTIFFNGPSYELHLMGEYGTVTNVTLVNSYVDTSLGQAYTYSGIYYANQSHPTYMMVFYTINDSCQTNPIGHTLPPGCDSISGNIHSVSIPCSTCLEVTGGDSVKILHKWEVQFDYTGASGAAIGLTLSTGSIFYALNDYVQTGVNTLGFYGILPVAYSSGNDTLTLTIIDSVTHDTSTKVIPLTLACDSPVGAINNLKLTNITACPANTPVSPGYTAQVVSTTCSHSGQPGPPYSSYTIITAFNNFTTDSFLGSVVGCVPCIKLKDLNGTRAYGPGTTYDTLTVEPDSGALSICLSYLTTDSCNFCSVTVCDSLPMPCDSGSCSISGTHISCTECLYLANKNPHQMIHIWQLSYYYTGANASSCTITGSPANPNLSLNTAVNTGFNFPDVYLFDTLNTWYSYDTLTLRIVDAITGDTCSHQFYVSMNCDTPVVSLSDSITSLVPCPPTMWRIEIASLTCLLNDGFANSSNYTPNYQVIVSIDNLTGDTVLGGNIGCNTCSSIQDYNHGPSMYAPGITYDTLKIAVDTSVAYFCLNFVDAGACNVCELTVCDSIKVPCHYCSIDSIWESPYDCWSYCVYDTTNNYRYEMVNLSFFYTGDTTASISNVFDGNPVTIIQPQVVTPGNNVLEAIVGISNPSLTVDNSVYQIVDAWGDTCYLKWITYFECDTSTPQHYPQCAYADSIDSVTCIRLIAGESSYSFALTINNPSADTVSFMPYAGINVAGNVTFNTYVLYPGNNTLTGRLSISDTAVGSVSFSMYFFSPCSYCSQTFSFATPHCDNDSLMGMRMYVVPNPASDKALITYSLDGISSADIIVIDALGNHLAEFDNVSPNSAIELNTSRWEAGVYIVAAVWKKNMLISQKLVILK